MRVEQAFQEANYRPRETPGTDCGNCRMQVSNGGRCWGFANKEVSPVYVCNNFEKDGTR